MFNKLQILQDFLRTNNFDLINTKLKPIIQSYSFHYISPKIEFRKNQFIQDIIVSNAIIIDIYEKTINDNEPYFIIGFNKTILVIDHDLFKQFIYWVFSIHRDIEFCFLSNTKNVFNQIITFEYKEVENDINFNEEYKNFNKKLQFKIPSLCPCNDIWQIIQSCISCYLIKQSFCKSKQKDRIAEFYINRDKLNNEPLIMEKDDYIELSIIGLGSMFQVVLIYQIEKGELMVIKKPHLINNDIPKLIKREIENYTQIRHPFIPQFYGTTKKTNYLIIEYIYGKPLTNISQFHFSEKEKFTLAFHLVTVFFYLHENHFIYRDLKPNNIIIDGRKRLVLIDFDRMIKEGTNNNEFTNDFSSVFNSPELNYGNLTRKSDVYSIGQMIYYIFKEEYPTIKFNDLSEYLIVDDLYQKCIINDVNERPVIEEIIVDLENIILEKEYLLTNIGPEELYDLGCISIQDDINKSIEYLTLSAYQNNIDAQYLLATIYFKEDFFHIKVKKTIHYYMCQHSPNMLEILNEYINYSNHYTIRNINKAIYFLKLAANQNLVQAQLKLGLIYCNNKYVKIDIDKSIYYFTCASNQNDPISQYNLGHIYIEGRYIKQDINKAINYFKLSASNGYSDAQLRLGVIYLEGKYVQQNISEAINYLTNASYYGNSKAHLILGKIYIDKKYATYNINAAINYFLLASKYDPNAFMMLGFIFSDHSSNFYNINKAIYYFSFAASNNISYAYIILGDIFFYNEYGCYNIDKSVYYYTIAAKYNIARAQNILGIIYSDKKYARFNIKTAIYYFTLAAKQNFSDALFNLGKIYYDNNYIPRDIEKAIYYLTLAEKQNDEHAQYYLGKIYYLGIDVKRNIDLAIKYLLLSANQNYLYSQFLLGKIYENEEFGMKNMKKAIYYYELSANQNCSQAQYELFIIYETGKCVQKDTKKSMIYLLLSAKNNYDIAQYQLGLYYYNGINMQKNIYNALLWFKESAKQNNIKSFFSVGFIFHTKLNDIKQAIHYYKEASSFNDNHAKNNLGVIYKSGVGDEIKKNIGNAEIYFHEAIIQKKDYLSMYNLANIYIYDLQEDKYIDKSIELLIKSFDHGFFYSINLLCIVLYDKYGYNIKQFKKEISKHTNNVYRIVSSINNILKNVNGSIDIYNAYMEFKNINIIYDLNMKPEILNLKRKCKSKIQSNQKNITNEFYEGFGADILH